MVIWTPRARTDLKAIHDYIARDSPLTAKRIIRELIQKTDSLAVSPYLGKKVPEFEQQELREIGVHSWRIIYQIKFNQAYVVTVVHKRRDFKNSDLSIDQ
ncbi:type II toxin-antitoxin system mRNA interferase toxin, RelE/StbE family [Methylomonas sp. Kb3]|uniref:type II toxin-antitoxin system RelE/ParE family toxin n=1 Tax=Methylomonas sp. Kb3 TaxID=1611544 RepID=UPI000C346230|nr:type II toxin-antitoxin system RelE/ParE family toxin [Methylomonas sp. Kb3]PKD38945.1 type II toxin-antitoxin system mRNA interferase toxin, RelE/StbE family [Methylomonas sp. Kb3]